MSRDLGIRPTRVAPYIKRKKDDRHDENFEDFVDTWRFHRKEIAIFLGAGASIGAINSKGAHLLSAYELRNEIWSEFMLKEEEKSTYDFKQISLMSLEHAAAISETKTDRLKIEELITERFTVNQPLWQHAVLPFLHPTALFTTNYDNLIELAYGLHVGDPSIKQYTPVYNVETYNEKDFVPLFKPHGSIDKKNAKVLEGGLVITQFDYFDVFTEREDMLNKFIDIMKKKCILFIGYSFTDFDIALHLYKKAKPRNRPAWYAIFPRNDANIRNMYFEKYRIKQIDRTFYEFISDLDDRINFIPTEWKFQAIKSNTFLSKKIFGFS